MLDRVSMVDEVIVVNITLLKSEIDIIGVYVMLVCTVDEVSEETSELEVEESVDILLVVVMSSAVVDEALEVTVVPSVDVDEVLVVEVVTSVDVADSLDVVVNPSVVAVKAL